jgi:hypothetical protein
MSAPLTASAERADVPHVAEIALGYIEYALECASGGPRRSPTTIRRLRSGQQFPHGLSIEFGAHIFLAQLERAGLLRNLTEPLPTTREALESLRERLRTEPNSFWSDPSPGESLHRRVWERWSAFDWNRFESADVAIAFNESDSMLDSLADFLWKNRHIVDLQDDQGALMQLRASDGGSLFRFFKTSRPRKKADQ